MDELMKMLEGLFEHMAGRIQQDEQEKEGREDDTEKKKKRSRVKMACATVLSDMRREIHSLERALAALSAKRDIMIEEHDALVEEIKSMDVEQEQSKAQNDEDEYHPQQDPTPETEMHERKTQGVGDQPESELNLDGMSRLERLQYGLEHAINVFNGSKMAFHFKAIIQLRLELIELATPSDRTEDELIAVLESGLKHAVEVLGNSPNAVNSRTMRQLWSDLIQVLKDDSEPKQ